jgi:hypothetical protein
MQIHGLQIEGSQYFDDDPTVQINIYGDLQGNENGGL